MSDIYLKEDTSELRMRHADGGEVGVSDEGIALSEGKGVAHQEECKST